MTRYFLLIYTMVIPLTSWGQIDTLVDQRDGKKYLTKKISNTTWMLENLDFAAPGSVGLTEEQTREFMAFNLHGRYYHLETIDSVCPQEWRLPDLGDWTDYFNFLVEENPRKVKLQIAEYYEENHYVSFLNYSKRIDLFEKGNPLNLYPTGRVEGGNLNVPDIYADYYAVDLKETFRGRSHIHIMNAWTTIHSHEHNMQPEKEEELRKFMVRCVRK